VSSIEWDGLNDRSACGAASLARRDAIADAGRSYDWPVLLQLLERTPSLVNSWRVAGTACYSPLHQAAHGGAPTEVVDRILALGAWRTLRTAASELAVDIARNHRHDHLVELLEPRRVRVFDARDLERVQRHFHDVVRGRTLASKNIPSLRLPEVAVLTEYATAICWFPVPGMYGGFKFRFTEDTAPTLVVESWCRVVEGSEQRHEITPDGARLVEDPTA
jgi:hypothetical protein